MKTLMYLTMTLNGYIAKENGDAPWPREVWKSYYEISKRYKVVILGRKTYDVMVKADEFKKIGNPFVIVLTRKKLKSTNKVAFVKSAKEAIETAYGHGFNKVLISGGGFANYLMIRENMVDEIYIDIVPMIFGKGTSLFKEGNFEARLKLKSIKKLSVQVMQLRYDVLDAGTNRI